jgi:hypothetical protein
VSEQATKLEGTWTHGVGGAFNDSRKERFALALASGMPIPDAAVEIGVDRATAINWAGHKKMKKRKIELRAQPALSQTFCVSIAMICADLYRNSNTAHDAGDITASNSALTSLYKIAKAEKSFLESYDAQAAPGRGPVNIVQALSNHLSANKQKILDAGAIDAEGDDE